MGLDLGWTLMVAEVVAGSVSLWAARLNAGGNGYEGG